MLLCFAGYQISNVIQCQPPASVTALNVNANWGLVGLGTGHGFVLFDYLQVRSFFFLNCNDSELNQKYDLISVNGTLVGLRLR